MHKLCLHFVPDRRLLAALLLAVTATAARANLLSNGSFEGPALTSGSGYYSGYTPDHWSGGAGMFWAAEEQGGWPAPKDGRQFDDLGQTGRSLSQSVSLAPGTYTLTWYDNAAIG